MSLEKPNPSAEKSQNPKRSVSDRLASSLERFTKTDVKREALSSKPKSISEKRDRADKLKTIADTTLEKKDGKVQMKMSDLGSIREAVGSDNFSMTEVLNPEVRQFEYEGQTFERYSVDGKVDYYFTTDDGSKSPLKIEGDELTLVIDPDENGYYTDEEIQQLSEAEIKVETERGVIIDLGAQQRYPHGAASSPAGGFAGGGYSGGGSASKNGGQSFEQFRPGDRPAGVLPRHLRSAPKSTLDRRRLRDDIVSSEAPGSIEDFKGTDWERYMTDDMAASYIKKWYDQDPQFRRMGVTGERVKSPETKEGYVNSFKTDFDNAKKFGWTGENQKRPIMIVKPESAYFFIPSIKGEVIDLENPDSFILYRLPVALGRGGFGNVDGSNATPTGLLEATAEETTSPQANVGYHRIYLDGRQTQENGDFIVNTNSKDRFIRMHEGNLNGKSLGCVRMGPTETAFTASQVSRFGSVFVNISSQAVDESSVTA